MIIDPEVVTVDRRILLRALVVAGPTVALSGGLWGSAAAAPAQTGTSPYGPLLAADPNGLQLPAGFTSRIIARSRQRVGSTGYTWHDAPDGGACFADPSRPGSWVYVSNSEISSTGGASAVRFNSSGSITAAYRVLSTTSRNCAGGAMPWGTWLSCEEVNRGYVYETFPQHHRPSDDRRPGGHGGAVPAGDGPGQFRDLRPGLLA